MLLYLLNIPCIKMASHQDQCREHFSNLVTETAPWHLLYIGCETLKYLLNTNSEFDASVRDTYAQTCNVPLSRPPVRLVTINSHHSWH